MKETFLATLSPMLVLFCCIVISFVGNAIVPAVLGAVDGAILYKYLLFTLPLSIMIYSWGIYILVPRGLRR